MYQHNGRYLQIILIEDNKSQFQGTLKVRDTGHFVLPFEYQNNNVFFKF